MYIVWKLRFKINIEILSFVNFEVKNLFIRVEISSVYIVPLNRTLKKINHRNTTSKSLTFCLTC